MADVEEYVEVPMKLDPITAKLHSPQSLMHHAWSWYSSVYSGYIMCCVDTVFVYSYQHAHVHLMAQLGSTLWKWSNPHLVTILASQYLPSGKQRMCIHKSHLEGKPIRPIVSIANCFGLSEWEKLTLSPMTKALTCHMHQLAAVTWSSYAQNTSQWMS